MACEEGKRGKKKRYEVWGAGGSKSGGENEEENQLLSDTTARA